MRFRFSVRSALVLVALSAILIFGAQSAWKIHLARTFPNPIRGTKFASDFDPNRPRIAGSSFTIVVDYAAELARPLPPANASYPVWLGVWFEDVETGLPAEVFSALIPLKVGGLESVSGTFTWQPTLDRPGRYQFRHFYLYKPPFGEWRGCSGGMRGVARVLPGPIGREANRRHGDVAP